MISSRHGAKRKKGEALATRQSMTLESFEFWKGLFEIASVVLLFFTFVCGAGALYFSNRVNERQASRLRQVDIDLTGAKTELGKQQERAANADARVAGLEKDAANAKAAQLSVETDLAKQREKTANAEKALLELQARLADRNLTARQQSSLIDQLKPWAGVDLDVLIWGDTAEIEIISGQILESLTKAGWHTYVGHAGGGGGAVRGIQIGTRSDADDNTVQAARALISALQSAGLASGPRKFDDMIQPMITLNTSFTGKAPIRLFIGSKPPN